MAAADMFDFTLSGEEQLIVATARRFAHERLQPGLRAHEAARGVPENLLREYAALGFPGLEVPAGRGGQGLGPFAKALVLEELAAGDAGATIALDGAGAALYPLLELGATEHIQAFAGDPARRAVVAWDVSGSARIEGGRISGHFPWVPADRAELAAIFSAERVVIVEDGLSLTPVKPIGLDAAGAAELRLSDAPIVLSLEGPTACARVAARARLYAGALLVGCARAAQEYALHYATERTAFGRPIAHHQALAFLLVDMATAVAGARMAVWQAAAVLERGEPGAWEASAAFAEAAEQALFVGPNAVQILGGHGFVRDYPVEKWMRDLRTLAQLCGGRDEAELAGAALALDHSTGLGGNAPEEGRHA